MPKETFLNLPQAKREKIINAAIAEFADSPYERASLSRIVADAGIAKGSMYQYFENKRELYLYIIDLVYQKKKSFLQDVFIDSSDFFAVLKKYYKKSYLFAVEYPLYHKIINYYWEYYHEEFEQEIKESKDLREADFIRMLNDAVKSGQVNKKASPKVAFFVYHSVGKELIDNFLHLPTDDTGKHLQFIEAVLDILAEGLQVRKE